MPRLSDLMSPEELAQEKAWAEQLKQTQQNLYDRVMEGIALANKKTKRKELYQKWRQLYGDDLARQYAKSVEAIFAGTSKLSHYEKFNHRDSIQTGVTQHNLR